MKMEESGKIFISAGIISLIVLIGYSFYEKNYNRRNNYIYIPKKEYNIKQTEDNNRIETKNTNSNDIQKEDIIPPKLERPDTFGKITKDLHENLVPATNESIEVLNLGIDDSIKFFGAIGKGVIEENIEKYKVDKKAKRVWVKLRGDDWVEITDSGYNNVVDYLKKHIVEE